MCGWLNENGVREARAKSNLYLLYEEGVVLGVDQINTQQR